VIRDILENAAVIEKSGWDPDMGAAKAGQVMGGFRVQKVGKGDNQKHLLQGSMHLTDVGLKPAHNYRETAESLGVRVEFQEAGGTKPPGVTVRQPENP
jgi:hypothetical protein